MGLESLIPTLGTVLAPEAIKTWGLFSLLLVVPWGLWWRAEKAHKTTLEARDQQIKALEAALADLQQKRLEEARQMIRVAETGTATMATRTQGDEKFLEVIRLLGDQVVTNGEKLASIERQLGGSSRSRKTAKAPARR